MMPEPSAPESSDPGGGPVFLDLNGFADATAHEKAPAYVLEAAPELAPMFADGAFTPVVFDTFVVTP